MARDLKSSVILACDIEPLPERKFSIMASEITANRITAPSTDHITATTITVPASWHNYDRFPSPPRKSRWQRLKDLFR